MIINNEIYLGVNVDHVATLRQARGTRYPDPIFAALLAEEAGADGITVHLREDRRHIQDPDVFRLKELLLTRLNLEMAVSEEMLKIAEKIKPRYCCLVPEKREELTTEGGLDVRSQKEKIKDACHRLKEAGIDVSLFINPDLKQIDTAYEMGAPIIEIHTGNYAHAQNDKNLSVELERVAKAARHAKQAGLQVNAGHGLNYQNVKPIAALKEISELNIGHSIVAQALFAGFRKAVSAMKQLMIEARKF